MGRRGRGTYLERAVGWAAGHWLKQNEEGHWSPTPSLGLLAWEHSLPSPHGPYHHPPSLPLPSPSFSLFPAVLVGLLASPLSHHPREIRLKQGSAYPVPLQDSTCPAGVPDPELSLQSLLVPSDQLPLTFFWKRLFLSNLYTQSGAGTQGQDTQSTYWAW